MKKNSLIALVAGLISISQHAWAKKTDPKDIKEISAGSRHTCVLTDKKVHCFGDNLYGQSEIIKGLVHPRHLTTSGNYNCVMDDEGIKCWGSPDHLGLHKIDGIKNATSLSLAARNTLHRAGDTKSDSFYAGCAVDDDGVKCWGRNSNSDALAPSSKIAVPLVVGVPYVGTSLIQLKNPKIVSLGSQICVIDDDGLKCWTGDSMYSNARPVPSNLQSPRAVAVGNKYSCVLDNEGVKCWASTGSDRNDKSELIRGLKNPKSITSSAKDRFCAVDDDGIKCWFNSGSTLNPTLFEKIPITLKNARGVATGYQHTCFVDDEGVKCWGNDEYGQSRIPVAMTDVRAIAAGFDHVCAIADQSVKCWGNGEMGQLEVPLGIKNPKVLAAGLTNTCVIDDDGVKCWGFSFNSHGQAFGKGTIKVPTGVKNPRAISLADDHHVCVLDDDGVKCWGSNIDNFQVDTPVNNKPPQFLASGQNYTCVIDGENRLACIGLVDGLGSTWKHGFIDKSLVFNPVLGFAASGKNMGTSFTDHGVLVLEGKNLRRFVDKPHCKGCLKEVGLPIKTNDVKQVSSKFDQTCLIDDEGAKCFTAFKASDYSTKFPKEILNPQQITVGKGFACINDIDDVKCWGRNDSSVTHVPTDL